MKKIIAAVVAASLLSGCATVMNGTSQAVNIKTSERAECSIGGQTVMAPSSVTLPRQRSDTPIQCKTEDGKTGSAAAATSASGWVFGNLVIGMLPGLIVDMISGGIYSYPEAVEVPLVK